MSTYSMLSGTNNEDYYVSFPSSNGIGDFLARIGAEDVNKTAETVRGLLSGFEMLPHYNDEAADCLPVAVRYAPMHLSKLPDMPAGIRPFCVMSICGNENRVNMRYSEFTLTTLIPMENMLERDGLNYLDQLFGTFDARGGRWFGDQDMNGVRNGNYKSYLNMEPVKTSVPTFSDLVTAIRAVELIYQGENVILKLEPRCGFNRRAVQLLKQIYSLLQPKLALESGFAAYQNPQKIPALLKTVGIRFFLVPAETQLEQNLPNVTVIDLSQRQPPLKPTPLAKAIAKWTELDWEKERQQAMYTVFKDTDSTFNDPALFIERTEHFFKIRKELAEWKNGSGQVESMDALINEYRAHQEWWDTLPSGDAAFREALPALVGKKLGKYNAEQYAEYYLAKKANQPIKEETAERYQFGKKFGATDERSLCDLIWIAQEQNYGRLISEKEESYRTEREEAEAKHIAALAAEKTAHTEAMEAEKTAHAEAMQTEKEAHAEAMETEKKAHAEAMEAEKTAHAEAMAAEKKAHADAMDVAEKQHAAAIKLAEDKLTAEENRYTQLEEASTKAYNEKVQELETVSNQLSETVSLLKTATEERDAAKLSVKKAVAAKEEAETSLLIAEKKRDDAIGEKEEKERELTNAREDLDRKQQEFSALQTEYDKLRQRREGTDDRPLLLRKFVWWIPLLATFLIGVLLCVGAWLVLSLAGQKTAQEPEATVPIESMEAPSEPASTTEQIDWAQLDSALAAFLDLNREDYTEETWTLAAAAAETAQACRDMPESTQEQIDNAAAELIAAMEQLKEAPKLINGFCFEDWADPATAEQLKLRVPEVADVMTEDLTVFSIVGFEEVCKVNAVITLQPCGEREYPTEYLLSMTITKELDKLEPEDLQLERIAGCSMVLQLGDQILVVYGGDEVVRAGLHVFEVITEQELSAFADTTDATGAETDDSTQLTEETVTSTDTCKILYWVNGEYVLDISAASKDPDWWRTVTIWSTDHTDLSGGRRELNTKDTPILVFADGGCRCFLFDYREAPDKISDMVDSFTDDLTTAILLDDFVLIRTNAATN